jgi:hypothetical protein
MMIIKKKKALFKFDLILRNSLNTHFVLSAYKKTWAEKMSGYSKILIDSSRPAHRNGMNRLTR